MRCLSPGMKILASEYSKPRSSESVFISSVSNRAVEASLCFLLQEADTTHEWTADEISLFLKCQTSQPFSEAGTTIANSESSSANLEDPLKAVAERVAAKLQPAEIRPNGRLIPPR